MFNAASILKKVPRLMRHFFWVISPREAEYLVLLRPSNEYSVSGIGGLANTTLTDSANAKSIVRARKEVF